MSDLSARARLVAAQAGELPESDPDRQLLYKWAEVIAHQGNIMHALLVEEPFKELLSNMLFDLAVMCALSGQDIQDMLLSIITKREMGVRKVLPKTVAPIPDATGTLIDPATKLPISVDHD